MDKKFCSIADSLSYIENLKTKIERMPDLLGFKSSDIAKNYKTLIQLSNSLGIIFLQYDLNDLSLVLLKYASDADLKLHRYGSNKDRLWEGSLITYNNLILLFHKVKHYKESLKLVYQAQNFVINIKKSNFKLSSEIEIGTHMLSFITLWRVGRASESVSYLQSSTDILNDFIEGKLQTKLSQNALDNLFGIVAASLSALKIVVEKNKKDALELIDKALNQVDEKSLCRSVLKDLMNFIRTNNEFIMTEENQEDWLCGDTYTKILIITCFVPLIDPKTPLIHLEELELSKQRIVNEGMSLKNIKKSVHEEVPVKIVKKRSKSIFVGKKTSKGDYFPFEETPRKAQPWWKNKQFFLDFDARKSENISSFISEPRRLKKSEKPTFSNYSPKPLMISPTFKYSRRNYSMLESSSKYNNDNIPLT